MACSRRIVFAAYAKLRIHIRQRRVIQDLGRWRREPSSSRVARRTSVRRGIPRTACTRSGSRTTPQRAALQYANHFGERDLGRLATEKIPSALALLAFDQALALQVEKDRFQKLLGKSLTCSEVGDEDGPSPGFSRQYQQTPSTHILTCSLTRRIAYYIYRLSPISEPCVVNDLRGRCGFSRGQAVAKYGRSRSLFFGVEYAPMTTLQTAQTLLDLLQPIPGSQTAIVLPDEGITVTYESLRSQVEAVANSLAAAGIKRGDRVAMALPNGLTGIVCFLAASAAGTAAPLNPNYREEEFRFYLEDTNARLLIVPPDGGEAARRAAGDQVPIVTAAHDSSGTVRLSGSASGASATAPSGEDIALVLHTSGSTGRPKRVPLKHINLAVSVGNVVDTYQLTPDDVSLCVMPLFHVHGLVASTLGTLATGGTVVVPPKFNPLGFWRTIRDHNVTWFSAVPTMHQLLLARAGGGD